MSLLGCLAITEGYIVAYPLPPIYRRKVTLSSANLSRDTQDYYLLPNFVPSAYGIQGLEEWQGQNPEPLINIQWPAIGINVSGQTQYPQYAIWLPNTVLVHPYSTELVIVGWRSPITGAIKVVGSVSDIENRSGDGVLWYIDKDSVNLASGSVTEGGTQNFAEGVGGNQLASIKVKENEFIYFIVHPNENFLFDPTRLDITITHVPLGRVQLPLVLKR